LLTVVEIYSNLNALQILPLLDPSIQMVPKMVPKMDVGITAHSSGTQARNKEDAGKDPVPEQDTVDLNRMVIDPDATLTEPVYNPDFIDLTLSD
jgi:hypothetical protein